MKIYRGKDVGAFVERCKRNVEVSPPRRKRHETHLIDGLTLDSNFRLNHPSINQKINKKH